MQYNTDSDQIFNGEYLKVKNALFCLLHAIKYTRITWD